MPFYVLRPDDKLAQQAGRECEAHIPFLLRDDGYYPPEINRYVRTRALCEWQLRLGTGGPQSSSKKTFQTVRSCWVLAGRLVQFLNWCETTDRDWRTVSYRQDLLLWQKGLVAGYAAAKGKPLSASSINALIDEACYFLTWTSEVPEINGAVCRKPFEVPSAICSRRLTTRVSTPTKVTSTTRVGSLAKRPSQMLLPSPQQLVPWLQAMRVRYPVKSLMSELILETGIRISECTQWRVDTLPPTSKWKVRSGKLPVWIQHGVKGPKVEPQSSEAVRPREILVPIGIAERIDHYRHITRLNQLRHWINASASLEEKNRRLRVPKPERLWLSEFTNQPFTNQQLYKAWVECPHCPDNWHPHRGREFFAVETVVTWMREDLAVRRSQKIPELSWLQGAMREQVRFLLSPLLGHSSDRTTMNYLKAAHLRLVEEFGHPALTWQQRCDRSEQHDNGPMPPR
jgi:integrase